MLGRCLITTSRACIASNGISNCRPSRASSSAKRLTCDTHLMVTLNTRSLPSPGSCTSNSTCNTMPLGLHYNNSVYILCDLQWNLVIRKFNLCIVFCRCSRRKTYLVSAYRQRLSTVHVFSTIKDWSLTSKYSLRVAFDHSLNNLPEISQWTNHH